MGLSRHVVTGLVLASFVMSFNAPLLQAAVAPAGQQQAGRFKPKTRIMQSEKLQVLGAQRWAELYPAGVTLNELATRLTTVRDELVANTESEIAPAVKDANIARMNRLLNLLRILDAPADRRSALLRQLPAAAGILGARPKPASHPIDAAGDVQQPDGSGPALPRAPKTDDCYDEENGWSECASDQDLIDAAIVRDSLIVEVAAMEAEAYAVEVEVDDHCNMYPEDCVLLYTSPAAAPHALLELEGDNDVVDGEPVTPLAGTGEPCSASGPEEILTCMLGVASAVLGIPTTLGEITALDALLTATVRPSKWKLGLALASAIGCSTALGIAIGGAAAYCYFYTEVTQRLSSQRPLIAEPSAVYTFSR